MTEVECKHEIGMFWPLKPVSGTYDVLCLICLVAETDGAIVEVGCNEGHTTRELALHFPDRKIVCIDTPQKIFDYHQAPTTIAKYARTLPNVIVLEVDSQSISDRDYHIISKMVGGIGLIFIDGGHTYDEVRQDSDRAIACLKNQGTGGIVCWHDYPHADVAKYINQLDEKVPLKMFEHGLVWLKL